MLILRRVRVKEKPLPCCRRPHPVRLSQPKESFRARHRAGGNHKHRGRRSLRPQRSAFSLVVSGGIALKSYFLGFPNLALHSGRPILSTP